MTHRVTCELMHNRLKHFNLIFFQYALIGNVIVEVLGGIFFFVAAIFVIKDRLRVHEYLASKSLGDWWNIKLALKWVDF